MNHLIARLKKREAHNELVEDQHKASFRPDFSKIQWLQKSILLASAIIIIAGSVYIDQVNNRNFKTHARDQADNALKIIAARLEGNILGNLQTAKAMVSAIYSNPAIDQAGFEKFAKPLFDGSAQLRNISATQKLTLQYMYPVEGNESAIGFDYHKRPDQLKDLLRSLQTQETIISGPFELIQGGQGLIARIPVTIDNPANGDAEVWGTVSAVIDLQRLYEASGLLKAGENLNIAIRKISADSSNVFFGNTNSFSKASNPVTSKIAMPSGEEWQLAAVPQDGWPALAGNASTIRLYLCLAGLIIYSMIIVISQQINRRQRNTLLLQSLFDLSPIGIALSDFNSGNFLQVNDTLLASTGYSREEFTSLNYWQLGARSQDEAEQYQLRALQKTGRYGPYERHYIRKDGSEFPVRLSGLLIKDGSGKSFVWSIIEDISAQRKTAEIMQRQQSLMRSMGAQARVGAWEYIVSADKMYWSEMTRKIFKVNDNFTPTNESIKEFYYTSDSQQRLDKAITEAREDGVPFSEEIKIRTANGRETWIHITGQAEFNQGRCVRVYGSVQDIDSRRKVRDELIVAKETAEAAVHAKSEFLAVMSHEIRTPMNGVLGMLNLLDGSPLNEDQARKVNIAKTSAQSLLSLINDILDFSKVDAGKLELENIVFNIRKLFDDIAASQALHAHEKGLELIVDQTAIKQTWVSGDPARLRQIVTNLLANAIKFTFEGNIILRAGLRAKNGQLILSCAITDTGIGIPNSDIKQLFSPFTQIDASTTRKYGGSGLGLSICKNLCELMGGNISVASTYHEGSTFTFTICLQDVNSLDHREQLVPNANHRQIFIVDQNAEFRSSLSNQLQLWGAKVSAIIEPNDLFDESLITSDEKGSQSTLIILDISHQDSHNTNELCNRLRQHGYFKDAVIVLCSSNHLASNDDLNLSDVNGFFLKPLSHSDIISILNLQTQDIAARKVRESSISKPESNSYLSVEKAFYKCKVLLVEDNPVNQEVGRCTLNEIGLKNDVAINGKIALEMLKAENNEQYTLILLDCQMPEMDGYQVCRSIRSGKAGEIYRNIPIIALTANAMTGDKEKCISAGMNDYLPKPFTPSDLITKLQRWLQFESKPSIAPTPSAPQKAAKDSSETEVPMWLSAKALDSAMGRPEVLKKLLQLFCQQIGDQMTALERAYTMSNIPDLTSVAHAVKGSAGQLHGMQLHRCAAKLEQAGKANDPIAIQQLYKEFKVHSENLKNCFENYLLEHGQSASNAELVK